MSDWQERITRETAPAIRIEHELRYRMAAPLVLPRGPWIDLGCGNGVAAHAAFGEAPSLRAALVDLDEQAITRAIRELGLEDAEAIAADLTDPADLARIEQAATAFGEAPIVTCFEVIEHLASFIPLLEWVRSLVERDAATFLMSVPNDAFWSIQNPHHATSWGEGAFEELRGLIPPDARLVRQVSLSGSALVHWEGSNEHHALEVEVGAADLIPSHFIAAIGARAGELQLAAGAVPTDMLGQRAWERERESELAVAQQLVLEQAAEIAEQHEDLRQRNIWFDQWRAYIHELERELGRPLSGTSEEPGPDRAADGQPSGETSA